MKSSDAPQKTRRCPWYLNVYTWSLVPVIAVGGVVAALVVREVSASHTTNQLVSNGAKPHQSGGVPSPLEKYNAEASRENTLQWLDLMTVASTEYVRTQQHNLGYALHSGSANQIRNDGLKWGERVSEFSPDRLEQFLVELQAVIAKIKIACADRRLVWLPLATSTPEGFRNVIRPLDSTTRVQNLLSLEVEYALHVRDGQRAMEALEAMSSLPKLFLPPAGWNAFQICYMNQQTYVIALQRAIMRDMWTEEQLESLRLQLNQSQISLDSWADLYEQNMQMLLLPSGISRNKSAAEIATDRVLQVPSFQNRLARVTEIAKHLADDGLGQLTDKANAFDKSMLSELDEMERNVIFQNTQVTTIASQFVYSENERRMLATAIALRIYRKKFGKWPASIDKLVDVGLGHDEIRYVDGMRLGYSAGSETNAPARLWDLVRVPVRVPNAKPGVEQSTETSAQTDVLGLLKADELMWERGRASPKAPAVVSNVYGTQGRGFELEASSEQAKVEPGK